MIDARKALGAAIEHRTEDEAQTKAITAHFEAQADIFTQCPQCGARLQGTRATVLSHQCAEFGDLIGA